MGHELYRMIRDGAPPTWTPAMRQVAMVIADDARDPSQGAPEDGGWPWSAIPVKGSWTEGEWQDGLTERTGMCEHTIRRALADLGKADYEMREQVAADSLGRPVFACRGHALRFRVPPLKPRQSPPDMADLTVQSPPDMADLTSGARRPKASQIRRQGEPNPSPRRANLAGPISPGLPNISPASQSSVVNSPLERAREGQVKGDDDFDSETRSRPNPGPGYGWCGACGTRYRVRDDGLIQDHGPRHHPCKGSRQPPAPADIETERRRQEKALAEWIRDHPQPGPEPWKPPW